MGGACSVDGKERGVYRGLVWKAEGKGLMGKPRCRWEDNIRIDLRDVGYGVWTAMGWLWIETVGWHL
jgi:hypothetical protein